MAEGRWFAHSARFFGALFPRSWRVRLYLPHDHVDVEGVSVYNHGIRPPSPSYPTPDNYRPRLHLAATAMPKAIYTIDPEQLWQICAGQPGFCMRITYGV